MSRLIVVLLVARLHLLSGQQLDYDKVELVLTNTGPAVIDSSITFSAIIQEASIIMPTREPLLTSDQDYINEDEDDLERAISKLIDLDDNLVILDPDNDERSDIYDAALLDDSLLLDGEPKYRYVWDLSSACKLSLYPDTCKNETYGGNSSQLTRTFTSFDVILAERDFEVSVTVFTNGTEGEMFTEKLVSGKTQITLTDYLNGDLLVSQNNTERPTPGDMYSTAKPVQFNLSIFDSLRQPSFLTTWNITGPKNASITSPGHNLTTLVRESGDYTVNARTVCNMTVIDQAGISHRKTRNQTFAAQIFLKDPVSAVTYKGGTSYSQGSNLTITITCQGSGPFTAAMKLLSPNRTMIGEKRATSDSCHFHVTWCNMSALGLYSVNYTLANDVSRLNASTVISVHKPPLPPVSAMVVFFAVLIAILAPALILFSFLKDSRRKQPVESADFSFHTPPPDGSTYSNVKAKVLHWLKRADKQDADRGVRLERRDSGNYGAMGIL